MQTVPKHMIFERDDYQCAYCGKELRDVADPNLRHMDHITPVHAGGDDIASNMVTACQRCNTTNCVSDRERKKVRRRVKSLNKTAGIPKDARVTGLGRSAARYRRRKTELDSENTPQPKRRWWHLLGLG